MDWLQIWLMHSLQDNTILMTFDHAPLNTPSLTLQVLPDLGVPYFFWVCVEICCQRPRNKICACCSLVQSGVKLYLRHQSTYWSLATKTLCIVMFDVSKIKPESISGPVKAQRFLQCLSVTWKWKKPSHFNSSWGHQLLVTICASVAKIGSQS